MRKDTGEGIVCELRGGEVLIAPAASGAEPLPVAASRRKRCAPSGCGGCGGCMALASMPNGYARRFSVPIGGGADYKVGDRVKYERFIPEPNLMSALVFGVPVAFAMAAMLCWLAVGERSLESPSAALCVVAAFFTGLLAVGAADSAFKRKYPASIIGGGGGGNAEADKQ